MYWSENDLNEGRIDDVKVFISPFQQEVCLCY